VEGETMTGQNGPRWITVQRDDIVNEKITIRTTAIAAVSDSRIYFVSGEKINVSETRDDLEKMLAVHEPKKAERRKR
jgi:hypothetical protein